WSATSRNVSIVKNRASGTRRAVWGDFKTDAQGREIKSPSDTRFSDHEVVMSGGDGWIDTDDGRAKIRWDGDFTVVYYSGMTFYYVSDPELNVGADGKARLTATLGGYATSQFDMSQWSPLRDRRVVLADIDNVDIASGSDTMRPEYEGVRVQVGKAGVPQVRSGKHWGAWPQSFVSFQQHTGQGSYWYSSGGQTDRHKMPLPIAVAGTSFGAQITVPTGDPHDTALPKESGGGNGDGGQNDGGGNGDQDNGGGNNNNGDNNGDDDPGNGGNGDGTGDDRPLTVDNAEFRWGFNNESNNAGYAPGTHNFFSAGKIDDPGAGGRTITRSDWDPTAGAVTIEKRRPDGSYDTATWRGLTTTPSGAAIDSPTDRSFSDHHVVIDGGEGTIDPRKRTARISWDGDFTVLYYSGMSFFYVSDPTLVVRNGRGTVTATLGGFGTSRTDTTVWKPLPDKRVTLANLGNVELDEAGFTAKPKYLGVRYDAPAAVSPQRHGEAFGSFPKSFVDYQVRTGQASYWYSSGGRTDPYKPALPMTVSYDAANAVEPPPDDGKTSPDEDSSPDKDDPAPEPEPDTGSNTDPDDEDETPRGSSGSDGSDDSDDDAMADDTAVAASPLSTTYSADQRDVRPAASESPERTWMWWLGGGLLAIAATLTLTTTLLTQRHSRES
ncbi:MAG TPA: hypothetical protein VK059_01230, partial [Nocardioidaceae bacterium]|nr:hypothetical protein [Nocardioidaceae bacterium]